MMPRMDGLTLLKKLRTQPNTATIPVLLFTAFRVPSHDIEDLNMPSSMIMNKGSMSVSAIRAAIHDALKTTQPAPQPVAATAQQPASPPGTASPPPQAQPPASPPRPANPPQAQPAPRPLVAASPKRPTQIAPSALNSLPPKRIDAK
jgi:DNA-binding NarL/FixJ family response regulator